MQPPLSCVTDANIWIDLYVGGLLDTAFQLPIAWIAPDIVLDEVRTPGRDILLRRGVREIELPGAQVQRVVQLSLVQRRVSVADLSALVLAQAWGVILLTGDGNLRQLAHQEGVRCHGTLWLLDEMERLSLLRPNEAADALEALLDAGTRLPLVECHARLDRWRGR